MGQVWPRPAGTISQTPVREREDDKTREHRPLYEAIVMKARDAHLAGATVLRVPMGFGHSSRLHTTKILRLAENLPIVVEIVDTGTRHFGKGPGSPIRQAREA